MSAAFEPYEPIITKIAKLNWGLILLIFTVACIGLLMLYSAAGGSIYPWFYRQFIYLLIFFPVMIVIAVIDIKFWFKTAYLAYALALILLIIVNIMGHNSMGATRWIKIFGLTVQPSEIMKICLVFALSKYFYNLKIENIHQIRYILPPLGMIALPAVLIFYQPDLGTAIILGLIGVAILFVAGVRMWKFVAVGIATLISIPLLWVFVLHSYQKERVLNFINPDNDPLGTGYNIIQSKIAIGSGGFLGKGYMSGTQGQLDFLPERQTDFIFTMLSEEFGFIGSFVTIILYLAIIFMATSIAMRIQHQFGRLMAIGISSVVFFHMFINMGMVMGLMPVVGAPLPLISYGGTITATILIGFGFLLNADLYKDSELENL